MAYNDAVGKFTYQSLNEVPAVAGNFRATVNWGDGSTSSGLVAGQGGNFAVTGMHTFTGDGTYLVGVTVADNAHNSVQWTSTLYVGTTPAGSNYLLGKDPTFNAVEGASTSATIGNFIDTDGNSNPALYSASVDWGDGTSPSAGTVTGSGGSGGFNVGGTHTYSEEGSYTISASVSDSDGDHFNITSTAQVTDAALSLVSTTSPSGVTSGTSFSSQLASFSDADPGGTSSDYSGTVAWGDGTTSAGTIGTSEATSP